MIFGKLGDFIRDAQNGVYDFTQDGQCSNCGECCSSLLPVSQRELDAIHHYVKKHDIHPYQHGVALAKVDFDFTCPFRNTTERKCNIYNVRPEICRDFKCDKRMSGQSASLYKVNRTLVNMWDEFGS